MLYPIELRLLESRKNKADNVPPVNSDFPKNRKRGIWKVARGPFAGADSPANPAPMRLARRAVWRRCRSLALRRSRAPRRRRSTAVSVCWFCCLAAWFARSLAALFVAAVEFDAGGAGGGAAGGGALLGSQTVVAAEILLALSTFVAAMETVPEARMPASPASTHANGRDEIDGARRHALDGREHAKCRRPWPGRRGRSSRRRSADR